MLFEYERTACIVIAYFLSYPFDLTEDPEEVEAGELLEVVERPRPRGQEAGEQRGVLGHVLQARRGSGIGDRETFDFRS